MSKQLIVLAILSALAFGALAGEVYKWTDDEGTTHFSAQPPTDRPYEVISTRAGRVGTVDPTAPRQPAAEATDPASGLPEMAEVIVTEPDPEEVARRCEQARENLFWLTERRRINVRDPETGEDRWLDDDQRLDMIDETEDFLREHCRG